MTDEQKVQDEAAIDEQAVESNEEQNAAAEDDTSESGNEALAAAQQEIADLKDQMLRLQADSQNIRRRAELDVEKHTNLVWKNSPTRCSMWSIISNAV